MVAIQILEDGNIFSVVIRALASAQKRDLNRAVDGRSRPRYTIPER